MTTQSPSAKAVVRSSLVQRLSRFVSLSSAEIEVLEDLRSTTRVVRHNREIITQGRRYGGLLVTIEGISVRYRILRDGRRQVLDIALPGILSASPRVSSTARLTRSALSPIRCWPASRCRCSPDCSRRNRGWRAASFWSFASEAAIYIEHLTDVGRRSALKRIAISCWIAGAVSEHRSRRRMSFLMPLTQELLADALGLSVPHVNRTLRAIARRRPGTHRRPPGNCAGRRGTVGAGRLRPIVSRPISSGRSVRRGRRAAVLNRC